jgi:hypothetical protein
MDKKKYDAIEIYMLIVFFIMALSWILFLTGCSINKGQDGSPGARGPKPVITTMPALVGECAFGGIEVNVDGVITVICNGTPGANGTNGKDGSDGPQGLNGSNGQNGSQGPAGPQGNPGTDLTPIEMVQFCPNVAPNYPTTFPEYGFIINGKLYGVYSANGGFLAQLPPGQYLSNAIGNSCTFTVNADGSISY